MIDGVIKKKFLGLEEFGNQYPNERSLKRALGKVGVIDLKPGETELPTKSIFGYANEDDE